MVANFSLSSVSLLLCSLLLLFTTTTTVMASQYRDEAQSFVNQFNTDYEAKHYDFEQQFWGTKMNLRSNDIVYSADNLVQTKTAMENLLSDMEIRQTAVRLRSLFDDDDNDKDDKELIKCLDIIIRTSNCYNLSPNAQGIRQETAQLESRLEESRNSMKLGYYDNHDIFIEQSSVGLRDIMRVSSSEQVRKAAYDGLQSIGTFILANGFIKIIKLRNQLAKQLGFIDYFDYKVSNAEGFGKAKLFAMLDNLELGTRPIMVQARVELAKRFGPDALQPWNTAYKMAGSIVTKMDPYFPFAKSVEQYIKSYAALNIQYRGAIMNLDLLDRKHKHSNGFCHWPRVAWMKHGKFQPSMTNFTSLADPAAVGSGYTALTTLMHEAGHAAHFANIEQPSPLFGQERAPTSVAYAENQSMFLDSLVGDAAWRAKYALDGSNNPIPFAIIEEEIRAKHPFAVFQLRAMLSVSYFEKALYELPEEEVTAERVRQLADEIERDIQGGLGPRPLLSVPHIISDEASCYYQGYTLAECSVHQTRAFFLARDGYIVDNPRVGPDLTEAYWKCGNSRNFLDIVQDFTGKPLSGDAWIESLNERVEDKVAREQKDYDDAVAHPRKTDAGSPDLNMTIRFVDGDELIADSSQLNGGVLEACKVFEQFVANRLETCQ